MSIYVSIFIILLSILRHSGNDHNVIKSDKIIFQRGWHTVPVYSIHFHLYSFSAAQKPGGIEPQLVWCVAFLYCFISLKENLVPNCSRQAVVSLGCIYTVLPQKKKKKKMLKRIKEAHWHWESERRPLPNRPSLSPLLCTGSFLSLGINTNDSELPLWKQTLLWAQMKMQANPVTHSCLSRTCQLCFLPVQKMPKCKYITNA